MKTKQVIGFDRKIELEWVDYVAELVSRGLPESEIREQLAKKLSVYGLSSSKRGALSKTITVLTRLWLNVSEDIIPLRDKAVDLHRLAHGKDKVALHVCLAFANYPFFFDVMTQIGRLLKLQNSFSSKQVTRRIVEKWGDTQRVKRSVGHVLQTLKLWGIIEPLQKISVYRNPTNGHIPREGLHSFVEDALKISLGNRFSIEDSHSHPAMFFLARQK